MSLWHGCAMVASKYPNRVSAGDMFRYSVDTIVQLGFTTTMSYANEGYTSDYVGETGFTPVPTTFKELLQTDAYKYLFDQQIPRHIMQLWTFYNGPASDPPAADVTSTEIAAEYTEVYDAACYLLQTYSGKEFIIKNWEGDWQLLTGFDPGFDIPSYRAERFIAFWGARQRAIHDAKRDTPSTSTVKYCMEFNRVLDDYGIRMHRDVMPHLKPDMVGWSAYEAINYWFQGWTRQAPDIHFSGENIKGFATDGAGNFVVVGTNGKVSFSNDNAEHFYPVDAGFSASNVTGVCYVDSLGIFVAVGAGGKIANSTDKGKTWTQQTSGTATNLNGIVTDGYNAVAFGDTHVLIWSFDTTSWNPVTYFPPGAPTTDYTCGYADRNNSLFAFGGTNGKIVYSSGTVAIDVSSGASFGANTVRTITSVGARFVAGGDGGKIATSSNFFGTPWVSQTSQFGSDAILGLATNYTAGLVVAVGTNGKISSSSDGGQTWVARTAGTGAYLNAVTYSSTEDVWAYACDGATGYSLDGLTWVVNGQGNMGGLNVNPGCMLSAPTMTLTGANSGTLTTASYWHPQKNAEANLDTYIRNGVARIRRIEPLMPIAITEFGFPQEQTNFTGAGLDVAGLIRQLHDTAEDLGLLGTIYWQCFDNEEQSPGNPRGFHLYYRNGSSATQGALSPAGTKYADMMDPVIRPLLPTPTASLQFVADDWSGSGNWTSRDANGWTATVTGTPTKQASSFTGRDEVVISASNYFHLATQTAFELHAPRTIEFIVKTDTLTGIQILWCVKGGTASPGGQVVYTNGTTLHWQANGGGGMIDISTSLASFTNKYVMIHVVADSVSNGTKIYINGAQAGTTATMSFTGTSQAPATMDFGQVTGGTNRWNGTIVEAMIHEVALSAATIGARAALFNFLKGY